MRLDEEGQVMEASGHLLLVRSRGLEFRSKRANGDCTDFVPDFLCVKGREISLSENCENSSPSTIHNLLQSLFYLMTFYCIRENGLKPHLGFAFLLTSPMLEGKHFPRL